MAIKLDDLDVIAEDGTRVTGDMVEAWEDAYSSGRLPEGYEVEGPAHAGRPKLYEGEMSTMTIRVPKAEKERLAHEAKRRGMTLSGYVRHVIETRPA